MYQNNFRYSPVRRPNSADRFFGGGFLGPFILGGITGGLLAPSFQRPIYGPMPIYQPPIYGPGYPVYQTQIYY